MRPPSVARGLLRALLPAGVRDEAVDELDELYALRVARDGRIRARLWYWRQALWFPVRMRASVLASGSLDVDGRPMQAGKHRAALFPWLADVRYSGRALRRSPGFAAIAVLTLALGIGANTAIFSVVRSVLLRPLPFPEADRLLELWESRLDRGWTETSFARANFWDVRDRARTFESIGGFEYNTFNLTGGEQAERVSAGAVSADFFRALRVAPVLGRTFAPGEDAAGAETRLAILSHALWSRRFSSDPAMLGRSVTLDGESYVVIGVLPRGDSWLSEADVYVPMVRRANLDRGSFELIVIGRLRDGVTQEAAQADLDRIARELASEYPDDRGMGIVTRSTERWVANDAVRRAIWVLMGAVSLLLLIACVNLANLLLARATGRTRERALRTALGASPGRLVRLYLTESMLLGALGATAGLGLAALLIRLLRQFQPGDIPRLAEVSLDASVLAFTVFVALVTGVVTGIVPALRTPYRFLASALRESERSVAGNRRLNRLRGVLVASEVALSLMLLVGAGLLIRSFSRVLDADRGFATENRLIAEIPIPGSYNGERAALLIREYVSGLEAHPQVISAGGVSMRPLSGVGTGMGYGAPDRPPPEDGGVPWASWRLITPTYLETMGVPLVAGRNFTEQDSLSRPWRVVISQRLAESLWPGEQAVGRVMTLWQGQSNLAAEVIGVAADMRDWNLAGPPSLAVYLCCGAGMSPVQIVLHTRGRPQAAVPAMRDVLRALDPNLPLYNIRTFEELVGGSLASRRFTMLLLGALACVALVLAMAGVYGVLSWSVSRRKAEIGMRIALGASRGSVLGLIVAQGMRPVVAGLLLGLAAALAVSRVLSSLLFEVAPADALTYATVGLALALAAALSCYLPARHATRLDVVAALREE